MRRMTHKDVVEIIDNAAKVDYRGQVIDRLTGRILARTVWYPTWESAHHAAEKLAKNSGYGERASIRVVEI